MRNILFSLGIAPLFFFPASPMNGDRMVAAQPAISISDTRIVEGNTGQRTVEIMVSLSQAASAPITVTYNMKNGTATDKTDYISSDGSVSFATGDIVKRISIKIIGELVCEEDEKFEIVLSNPSGATLGDETGTMTIVNDDCKFSGILSGGGNFAGNLDPNIEKNLSVYEVRFTHTGFTTFFTGPSDCPIRSNGIVVLTGLLGGVEKVGPDDDIEYRGVLQLDMDIDICSADGEGDQAKLCGMRAIGSGPVYTTLEIYFDGRGGYVKIENRSGSFLQSVTGTCGQEQMDEEKGMIPNKTIASMFNGRELPKLIDRTLRVGRYVDDDGDGNVTVVEVLRVVKKP